jgi:hypothetical protein
MSLIRGAGSMSAIEITRQDLRISWLPAEAARTADAKQARRILAIAIGLDGHSRLMTAQAGGMDRQTPRDRVIRSNAGGLAGLADRPRLGRRPRLAEAQRSEVAKWEKTVLTARAMALCAGVVPTSVTASPPNSMFICMSEVSASC